MIYFDYGDPDEPHERSSALERTSREIAERAVWAQLESIPLCSCLHPYAVVRLSIEPNGMFFLTEGVKSSCCSINRANVEGALANPALQHPVRGKIKERVSIPR